MRYATWTNNRKHESYDCSSAMPAIYAMQGMHELFRPPCEDWTGVAGCSDCDKIRGKVAVQSSVVLYFGTLYSTTVGRKGDR